MSAYDFLKKLASTHRYAGTENELKAANLIESEFKNSGYEVEKEETEYIKSEKYIFVLFGISLTISGTFTILSGFFNTLILGVLILLYFGFLAKVYPKIELKFAKSKSVNIIATLNPAMKSRIIVCAHYDSPRVMGKYLQKMLKPLRKIQPLFSIIRISFIVVLFLFGVYIIVETKTFDLWRGLNYGYWSLIWWFFMVFTIIQISFTTFFVSQIMTKKYALGADDNASGIAVLLETARRFKEQKDKINYRIDFACFAAEERGLFGSRKWVNKHYKEFDRNRTYVLNLDCVGRGKKFLLIKGLGTIFKKHSDEMLYKILKKTCTELKYPFVEDWGSGSDHAEFLEKKIKCVAVLRADTEKANIGHKFLNRLFRIPVPKNEIEVLDWIHTEDDVPEKINTKYLDETVTLTMKFIENLICETQVHETA